VTKTGHAPASVTQPGDAAGVRRAIEAFTQDEHGDWVAHLACLHRQHVRHRPPFWDRPWVETPAGRAAHVGTPLDCPLCDRAELPGELDVARTVGPFEAEDLPAGLRRAHRVADRTWGRLRVLEGTVEFELGLDPPVRRRLEAGDTQAIPPGVVHRLVGAGSFRLVLEFLTRPRQRDPEASG
jgi:tellurite methyltransferase